MELTKNQQIQEEKYNFPYHYLDLVSELNNIEYIDYLNIVKDLLILDKNTRVFDFGCGDGRFEYELRNRDCEIIGLDYSEKAIGFAKLFNPTTSFYFQNLNSFEDNKFDYIVTIDTLEHIPIEELDNILNKLKDLLKDSGKLIITVPSKNISTSKKHYQHFDKKYLEEILKGKFKIEKIIGNYEIGLTTYFYRILKGVGRIINNDSYSKFVKRFYKKHISICDLNKCRRLIVVCSLSFGVKNMEEENNKALGIWERKFYVEFKKRQKRVMKEIKESGLDITEFLRSLGDFKEIKPKEYEKGG